MCKPIIKCSRCNETFCTGLDYRFHFDKHLDDWYDCRKINKNTLKKLHNGKNERNIY